MVVPLPAPCPSLSQRLALILQSLRKAIAACAGRDRTTVAVALRVWPYLHRLAARLSALALRIQAGAVVVASRTRLRAAPLAPCPRPPALPRGFAWLIRLAPESAALGGQVRHWMADPELASLLATAPQAARILRPLCRMLAIEAAPDLPGALFGPPDLFSPAPVLALPAPQARPTPPPAPTAPTRLRPSPRRRAHRLLIFGAEQA